MTTTQITTKPLVLSEITHAQLLESQVPESLPVTWERVRSQTPSSLPLAVAALVASFQIPHGLVPVGGGFTCRYLSEMLFFGYHHCYRHPHCHLVFKTSAAGAGPGLLQARQLFTAAQAGIKEPCLATSPLYAPNDGPASPASSYCLSSELWESPGGAVLPEHSVPPACPCPLSSGLFLLQPDFLTIYSSWSEDGFPPGGSSC